MIAEPATSIPPGPALAGNAYVGHTLVGNVGEWKAPDTFFERRWEQCSADGTGCVQINKVASVPPTSPGTSRRSRRWRSRSSGASFAM